MTQIKYSYEEPHMLPSPAQSVAHGLSANRAGLFLLRLRFNKVFLAPNKAAMLETLSQAGIWRPELMAPVVAGSEMVFGGLLTLGLLSRLSAAALFVISATALVTVGIHHIPPGQTVLGWYSWLLYLPEPWYLLVSAIIGAQGGGPMSLDAKMRPLMLRNCQIK